MTEKACYRHYINDLQDNLDAGTSTEHMHRPAFKSLLESVCEGVTATNEPRRIECGAPDFSVGKGANQITVGYIEAKDIGVSLDAIEQDSNRAAPSTPNGEQLRRYRVSLSNLLFTNYTEFRWYVDGEHRMTAELAHYDGVSLSMSQASIAQVDEVLTEFLSRDPEPIFNASDLAKRMARPTHMIREVVREAFGRGRESQDVKDLYKASKDTLVPNLTLEDFADMFAQTLSYGLFAARVNYNTGDFERRRAVYDIPAANPFLREVFNLIAGHNSDSEPFIGFVDDLAQLLGSADMEAILADFGKRGVRQDPVMHFYETFLAAYDPDIRERRGVFYTPEPVISYIVRSVDHILKGRFGCADGLGDPSMWNYETLDVVDGEERRVTRRAHRVLILDPACGTGSFCMGS